MEYPSSEHAYMAGKTLDPEIRKVIASLPTAAAARNYGQTIELRPDWDTVRISVMYAVLASKFCDNPYLMEALQKTGHKMLEESNDWGDKFWGVVYDKETGEYIGGENNLGKCLMRIRDTYKLPA